MGTDDAEREYAVESRTWDVNEGELEALLNRYAEAGFDLEEAVRGGDRKTLFVFERPRE